MNPFWGVRRRDIGGRKKVSTQEENVLGVQLNSLWLVVPYPQDWKLAQVRKPACAGIIGCFWNFESYSKLSREPHPQGSEGLSTVQLGSVSRHWGGQGADLPSPYLLGT